MKNIFLCVLLVSTFVVSGCSSMSLASMYKMMSFDPLEVEPSEVVVAVQVPVGIVINNNDVVIKFNVKADDPNYSFEHEYFVNVNEKYELPDELKQKNKVDSNIFILQLNKNDALEMRHDQDVVKDYKKNSITGTINMSVNVNSACKNSDFSSENSELNVYLKLNNRDDFFAFMEDVNVFELERNESGYYKPISFCS